MKIVESLSSVARGARVPTAFRGVAYERVLNTTRPMPRDTSQRLLLEGMHAVERWENRPAEEWDVSRLDHRDMVLTLEESIRQGRIDDPGTREPLDILRGLGLLVDGSRLSRAALEALREVLANAFVHRDYAVGGGSVGVALYDDRLEIISIGDLHFGRTPEALFLEHESKPWNPMVARIGKSERAVERAIRKLRETGRLARVGPDKTGHWQVIE